MSKQTTYEKLNSFLGERPLGNSNNVNKISDKQIISNNKEELETEVRQIQQTKYLSGMYGRIVNNDYVRHTHIETERRLSFIDFETMEYYPLIANALDIMAEEATVKGENGKMLNIYSNNDKIKKELEDLFYNKLDIDATLYQWTRSTIKYGDNFVYLLCNDKDGVVGAKQMANVYMSRVEKFNFESDEMEVAFRDDESGMVFNRFNMAHFRLVGDDSRLPYGTSILEKVRKLHKMLVLAEDAMMIYRLTRSGKKNVFKVDVGNINEKDRDQYITKVATGFKRAGQVETDGKINFRYNVLNQTQDLFIPTIDGKALIEIDSIDGDVKADIPDIEFLLANLIAGLGIPRPLLGFDETAGEGKNLSMMDVRFSRKINRIQQTMINELNSIAIIHLFLLGYSEKEVFDFSLTLSNPSIQADILRIEHLTNKINLYTSAVTPNEATQIAPMSETMAKKEILNMSDNEIIDDIKVQFIERGIGEEFRNKVQMLRGIGLFDNIIDKFKKDEDDQTQSGGNDQGGDTGGDEQPDDSENPFAESKLYLPTVKKLMNKYNNNIDKVKKHVLNENIKSLDQLSKTLTDKEDVKKKNKTFINENTSNVKARKTSHTLDNILDDIELMKD